MTDYSFDLQRIFIGNLPLLFLFEIVLRTVVLYIYSLICLRLLGKRSTREFTPVDVILIVALGSAVGDPMFYPEVPLVHGMLVIGLVVGIQRLGFLLANDHERVEKALKGSPSRLVVDGAFDLETRKKTDLSRGEIFAMLRQQGYSNLGQVERMYIETDGSISHYPFSEDREKKGLPMLPPWELDPPEEVAVRNSIGESATLGCSFCGQLIDLDAGETIPPCPRCHRDDWVKIGDPT